MAKSLRNRYAEMLSQGYDADVIREAPDVDPGNADPSLVEVQNFLKHYGYLDYEAVALDARAEPGVLDETTANALMMFQRRYSVSTLGILDAPTRELLAAPRCAVPDVVPGESLFFSTRCDWRRRNLTYAFGTLSTDVGNLVARNVVRRAFNTWTATCRELTFTEVAGNANPDIFVGWRPAQDSDISMVGVVGAAVAHADFPPGCGLITNGPPKPIRFDDEEHRWVDGAVANSLDIETTCLHEIGHVLDLNHSNVRGSVMWPYADQATTLRTLQKDDLEGIRSLYR